MSKNKIEVEECRILDINVLKDVCKRGFDSGEYIWKTDGEVTGKIGYSIKMTTRGSGILDLDYVVTDRYTGETRKCKQSIWLDSTECNYGGLRYWMLCPLIKNGVKCYKRVSKLYLPLGGFYFGCRDCYDLTYESKSKDYHNPMRKSMNAVFKYAELADKTKRMTYKGKLTRNAKRLIRAGYVYGRVFSDDNVI